MSDQWYELSSDVIDKFNEVLETKSFSIKIPMDFIGNAKQKSLVAIKKIPANYAFKLGQEVQVIINEELYDKLTDPELIEILFEQEIDKLSVNIETGAIKVNKLRLITSPGLVNKYGLDKVCQANNVEDIVKQSEEELL